MIKGRRGEGGLMVRRGAGEGWTVVGNSLRRSRYGMRLGYAKKCLSTKSHIHTTVHTIGKG